MDQILYVHNPLLCTRTVQFTLALPVLNGHTLGSEQADRHAR